MNTDDYGDLKTLLSQQTEELTDAIRRLRRDVLAASIVSVYADLYRSSDFTADQVYAEADHLLKESDRRRL